MNEHTGETENVFSIKIHSGNNLLLTFLTNYRKNQIEVLRLAENEQYRMSKNVDEPLLKILIIKLMKERQITEKLCNILIDHYGHLFDIGDINNKYKKLMSKHNSCRKCNVFSKLFIINKD